MWGQQEALDLWVWRLDEGGVRSVGGGGCTTSRVVAKEEKRRWGEIKDEAGTKITTRERSSPPPPPPRRPPPPPPPPPPPIKDPPLPASSHPSSFLPPSGFSTGYVSLFPSFSLLSSLSHSLLRILFLSLLDSFSSSFKKWDESLDEDGERRRMV